MKYCFLILVLLLMLLPEVTPGNQVFFSTLPAETKQKAAVYPAEKSLSNCPSTDQDSYLKQAFCSCKSLLTEDNSSNIQNSDAGTSKQLIAQNNNLQGQKNKAAEGNFISRLFGFSFSSASEK